MSRLRFFVQKRSVCGPAACDARKFNAEMSDEAHHATAGDGFSAPGERNLFPKDTQQEQKGIAIWRATISMIKWSALLQPPRAIKITSHAVLALSLRTLCVCR
jgi:hypothetical protein